jgi:hypothetical protein
MDYNETIMKHTVKACIGAALPTPRSPILRAYSGT